MASLTSSGGGGHGSGEHGRRGSVGELPPGHAPPRFTSTVSTTTTSESSSNSSTTSTNHELHDLQARIDGLTMSGAPVDGHTIDELARQMIAQLGLTVDNPDIFRSVAQQMVEMSISKHQQSQQPQSQPPPLQPPPLHRPAGPSSGGDAPHPARASRFRLRTAVPPHHPSPPLSSTTAAHPPPPSSKNMTASANQVMYHRGRSPARPKPSPPTPSANATTTATTSAALPRQVATNAPPASFPHGGTLPPSHPTASATTVAADPLISPHQPDPLRGVSARRTSPFAWRFGRGRSVDQISSRASPAPQQQPLSQQSAPTYLADEKKEMEEVASPPVMMSLSLDLLSGTADPTFMMTSTRSTASAPAASSVVSGRPPCASQTSTWSASSHPQRSASPRPSGHADLSPTDRPNASTVPPPKVLPAPGRSGAGSGLPPAAVSLSRASSPMRRPGLQEDRADDDDALSLGSMTSMVSKCRIRSASAGPVIAGPRSRTTPLPTALPFIDPPSLSSPPESLPSESGSRMPPVAFGHPKPLHPPMASIALPRRPLARHLDPPSGSSSSFSSLPLSRPRYPPPSQHHHHHYHGADDNDPDADQPCQPRARSQSPAVIHRQRPSQASTTHEGTPSVAVPPSRSFSTSATTATTFPPPRQPAAVVPPLDTATTWSTNQTATVASASSREPDADYGPHDEHHDGPESSSTAFPNGLDPPNIKDDSLLTNINRMTLSTDPSLSRSPSECDPPPPRSPDRHSQHVESSVDTVEDEYFGGYDDNDDDEELDPPRLRVVVMTAGSGEGSESGEGASHEEWVHVSSAAIRGRPTQDDGEDDHVPKKPSPPRRPQPPSSIPPYVDAAPSRVNLRDSADPELVRRQPFPDHPDHDGDDVHKFQRRTGTTPTFDSSTTQGVVAVTNANARDNDVVVDTDAAQRVDDSQQFPPLHHPTQFRQQASSGLPPFLPDPNDSVLFRLGKPACNNNSSKFGIGGHRRPVARRVGGGGTSGIAGGSRKPISSNAAPNLLHNDRNGINFPFATLSTTTAAVAAAPLQFSLPPAGAGVVRNTTTTTTDHHVPTATPRTVERPFSPMDISVTPVGTAPESLVPPESAVPMSITPMAPTLASTQSLPLPTATNRDHRHHPLNATPTDAATADLDQFQFNLGMSVRKQGVTHHRTRGSDVRSSRGRLSFSSVQSRESTSPVASSKELKTNEETPPPVSSPSPQDDSSDDTVLNVIESASLIEDPAVDYSGRTPRMVSQVVTFKEEADQALTAGNYRQSVQSYTLAIRALGECSRVLPPETMPILQASRATALLRLGAFDAATMEMQAALQLTPSLQSFSSPFEALTSDAGVLWQSQLFVKLGRAQLRKGDYDLAAFNFQLATERTQYALKLAEHIGHRVATQKNQLHTVLTEATLGQSEANRLRECMIKVARGNIRSLDNPTDKGLYSETLAHVQIALTTAPGCVELIQHKVELLAKLQRWRELAGYCERHAALNVAFDDLFTDDLEVLAPFPGTGNVQSLSSSFFDGTRDEDGLTADRKLTSRSIADAVLRLPYSITRTYVRSLRLEERYPAASAAITELKSLVRRGTVKHDPRMLASTFFLWLDDESSALARTKEGRERGDELYRNSKFEEAAASYASVLTVDGENASPSLGIETAGGRLHAVLHCNRAACLIALKRFKEALEECNRALRIHPRYMKALLRKSRCYTSLHRYDEAIAEFKRWIEMVEDARRRPISASSTIWPHLFDGPHDVPDNDLENSRKELDDVIKAKRRAETAERNERLRVDREEQQRRSSRPHFSQHSSFNAGAGPGYTHQRYNGTRSAHEAPRWDGSSHGNGPSARSNSSSRPSQENHHHSYHSGAERPAGGYSNAHRRVNSDGSPRAFSSNHYLVLGVGVNASTDDIKKAYRRLALKWHPDKNQDPDARSTWDQIQRARDDLADPAKRRDYDSTLNHPGRHRRS